jgi:hypothetical protein
MFGIATYTSLTNATYRDTSIISYTSTYDITDASASYEIISAEANS